MRDILIPEKARKVMNQLEAAGFDTYVVGGCVRDSLLGKEPQDWDMCTAATPEEMKGILQDFRTLETGIKHGTLTVMSDDLPLEITTFRKESTYSDGRHPDAVSFSRNIEDDLLRRDFTVNAMAWSPAHGLKDYHGGLADLDAHILRAVGNPEERFCEDALRILRCLRFAAQLNFDIHEDTAAMLLSKKHLLANISAERINAEFSRFMVTADSALIDKYREVLAVFIPELEPCFGFKQNNPFHYNDVFGHTLEVVANLPPVLPLKLAGLLHDIGKPACYSEDGRGTGHFFGHGAVSAETATNIMNRLCYDNRTSRMVIWLVENHDIAFGETPADMRRSVSAWGYEKADYLLQLIKADQLAHNDLRNNLARIAIAKKNLEDVRLQNPPVKVSNLAIDGSDLISAGVKQGKEIGLILNQLLDMVLDNPEKNSRPILMQRAEELIDGLE